jgi:hypothetical protein
MSSERSRDIGETVIGSYITMDGQEEMGRQESE